jgi:hypothetical protein
MSHQGRGRDRSTAPRASNELPNGHLGELGNLASTHKPYWAGMTGEIASRTRGHKVLGGVVQGIAIEVIDHSNASRCLWCFSQNTVRPHQ